MTAPPAAAAHAATATDARPGPVIRAQNLDRRFLVDLPAYLVAAAVTLAFALFGLRLGVVVFGRESFLTRWK